MYSTLSRGVTLGGQPFGGNGMLSKLDLRNNIQPGYGMHVGHTFQGKNTDVNIAAGQHQSQSPYSPRSMIQFQPPVSPTQFSSSIKGPGSPTTVVCSPKSESVDVAQSNSVRSPHARDSRASSGGHTTPGLQNAVPRNGSPRVALEGTRLRDKSNFAFDDRDGPQYARMTIAQSIRNRSLSCKRKTSIGLGSDFNTSPDKPAWVPSAKLNRGTNSMSSGRHREYKRSQSSTPRRSRDLLFADLYDDAVARRCRSLLDTQQKEVAEREESDGRIRNFQESLLQSRRYRLKDQRSHSERERDFAKRKQEFLVRSQEQHKLRQQRELEQCSFHPNITKSTASQSTKEKNESKDKQALYLAALLGVRDTTAAVHQLSDKEKQIFGNLKALTEEQAQLPERLKREYGEVRDRIQVEETKKVIEFLNLDEGKDYLRQRVAELQKPPAEAQAVIVNDLVQSSHSRVQEKVMTSMHIRRKELESNLELRKLKLQHELDHIRKAKRSLESPADDGLNASYRQAESDLATAELRVAAPSAHVESFDSLPTDTNNSSSAPSDKAESSRLVVLENNLETEHERELHDHETYRYALGQAQANERIFRSDSESSSLSIKNREQVPPAHSIGANTTNAVVPPSVAASDLSSPVSTLQNNGQPTVYALPLSGQPTVSDSPLSGQPTASATPLSGQPIASASAPPLSGQPTAMSGAQHNDSRKIFSQTSSSNNFGNTIRAFNAAPTGQRPSGTPLSSAYNFPSGGLGLGNGTPQSFLGGPLPAADAPALKHGMNGAFAPNFSTNRLAFQHSHTSGWGSQPQKSTRGS